MNPFIKAAGMQAILKENPGYKVLGRAKLKTLLKGRVSPAEIDEYIDTSELHQTHARAPTKQRTFKRITAPPNSFQIDVVVYPRYKSSNGGKDRFLLIEDILTRKAWAYVLPSNSMADVLVAYTKFADQLGKRLISVEGDDFFSSKAFLDFNSQRGITVSTVVAADEHMVKGGGDKLGLIDRLCRTLKDLLGKLIKVKGNTKWTGFLHEVIELYNSTPHRSLNNMSPEDAYKDPEAQAQKMTDDQEHNQRMSKHAFAVGDQVRIRLPTSTFGKEGQRFSTDLYRVASIVGNRYQVTNAGQELGRTLQASEMRHAKAVNTRIPQSHTQTVKHAEAVATHARKLAREKIMDEPLKAVAAAQTRAQTRSQAKGRTRRHGSN